MSISRWDPRSDLISLREAMNSLLEESFVRPRPGMTQGTTAGLAVDVHETADQFVVTASVPGVRPEDVEISVLGDTLRVRGEQREEQERSGGEGDGQGSGGRWLIRERRSGSFERTIGLPTTVKADEASAEFRDGVLTITLPKADEAKPRSIPVRSAAGAGRAEPIDVTAQESGQS